MNEKEKKQEVKFTITATKKDLILDEHGNPIPGFVIRYISEKGSSGYIEIPERGYSKEKALKLITEDVMRLEELL